MPLQHSQWGAGLQTPHPDGLVTAACSQHGVLIAHSHVGDLSRMAPQGSQQPPAIRPPDLHQAVVRALGKKAPIGLQIQEARDRRGSPIASSRYRPPGRR